MGMKQEAAGVEAADPDFLGSQETLVNVKAGARCDSLRPGSQETCHSLATRQLNNYS